MKSETSTVATAVALSTPISTETVNACEQITALARSGEIVGIAYVTITRRQTWGTGIAGAARLNQVFAAGGMFAFASSLAREIME